MNVTLRSLLCSWCQTYFLCEAASKQRERESERENQRFRSTNAVCFWRRNNILTRLTLMHHGGVSSQTDSVSPAAAFVSVDTELIQMSELWGLCSSGCCFTIH